MQAYVDPCTLTNCCKPNNTTHTPIHSKFADYGGHAAGGYRHAYLTAAAAIGASPGDADEFCRRFVRTYREFLKKASKATGADDVTRC